MKLLPAVSVFAICLTCNVASSQTAHTSRSSFDAELPTGAVINELTFDSQSTGSTLANNDVLQDIQFEFDFGDVLLRIADSDTTSSTPNYLGTTDLDLLQDGDSISFGFPDAIAVGLRIISADELVDDDLTLTFLGLPANLVGLDIDQTLSDGSFVYFLGLTSDDLSGTTASLTTIGGGFFLFNIDDIVVVYGVQPLLGDVNLDGTVNLLDVDFFIDRLATGEFQAEADCNEDGEVNLLDIDPFIAILGGG